MNDSPKWKVARLDEIERRGRDIPVREHLGLHAFGVNAYTPGDDGILISEHDEAGSGQEELYIVLDGNATFEVDGQTIDAPAGTYVSVPPASRRKATGEGTVLAIGGYREVRLIEAASSKPIATLSGNADYIRSIVFSPDGKKLVWASGRTVKEGGLNLFIADWR